MAIKWKKGGQFDPAVILEKIDSVRSISSEGRVTFAGFEIQDCLPALHSMLEFPPATVEVDTSDLVWRGLAKVGKDLNKVSFLGAINKELGERLATKEETYCLLTSISLDGLDVSKRITSLAAEINILAGPFSSRFDSRKSLLLRHSSGVPQTPENYCNVSIKVKAKSTHGAVNKALRGLDLQRAVWCLLCNAQMQFSIGQPAIQPINVIRLGSQHTLHRLDGSPAADSIWFEPGFSSAPIFRMPKPSNVKKDSRWVLRQIAASPYAESLRGALTRYVRAFDEKDFNSALLRLWSALEILICPDRADYEKVVQRCAFLFKERSFHKQMLEHLREYRNKNIHAGEESDSARTHCFQLQFYFRRLMFFHIRNARYFRSLPEANLFLDSPVGTDDLNRRLQLIRKAVRFTI